MLNSSITLDSSKVLRPKGGQAHFLTTAISKIGDSSFVSKNHDKNLSPARMRLFRESTKPYKGLEGLVVGEFHPLKPTHVFFALDNQSPHSSAQRQYRDSAERAKAKFEKIQDWSNYKFDIQLQLQNNSITKLNNQLAYSSYQPNHQSTRPAAFVGGNLNNYSTYVPYNDIRQFHSTFHSPSQLNGNPNGWQGEQYPSIGRILKTNRY